MSALHLVFADSSESRAQARSLIAEVERADGASPISDQALIATEQGSRTLLLLMQHSTAAVSERVCGVGVVGEGELDLALLPEFRSPEIETEALQLLLTRATGEQRFWVHGERPATEAALTNAGFVPARSLYRMALDPALLPTGQTRALDLTPPAGFSLRAYGTATNDDAAWVAANAAAFATHPEQGRITIADFAQMRQEPWFDSADLILLDAGDQLAGSTWVKTLRDTDDQATEPGVTCELYAVGVRPEYAGKGLGRLLLDVTLARMAEHAPHEVTLYVDGDNTAALRLYESAAFTVDSSSRQWLLAETGTPNATIDS